MKLDFHVINNNDHWVRDICEIRIRRTKRANGNRYRNDV